LVTPIDTEFWSLSILKEAILSVFLEFAAQNNVLPLTQQSVMLSAEFYASLRRDGTPGVAPANNLVLITHNQRHFSRIEGLELQDWSQS
jgi:tRNA(fMet)-specific endonuclease VapC